MSALNTLNHWLKNFPETDPMPVLFLGHGSPMNAIEENEFVEGWRNVAKTLPKPKAILCISAHWETDGTKVIGIQKPKTIHDFYGFPQPLFDVEYPANGSPELAEGIVNSFPNEHISLDKIWGFDHGSWSVVKHLYPSADVPMVELSIDIRKSPTQHFELAQQLKALRKKGVLIIGSGNLVHNLGVIDWRNPNGGYDWANEADYQIKKAIESNDVSKLVNYTNLGREIRLAVPSPEHFIPSIYSLGMKNEVEEISFFNDKMVLGSISMASFIIK